MLNNDEQSGNLAARATAQQNNAHRAIADEWLRRAIKGIREMHQSEDARREVAQRLF